MEPWNPEFPVGRFKQALLGRFAERVGFTTTNYDVAFSRFQSSPDDLAVFAAEVGLNTTDPDIAVKLGTLLAQTTTYTEPSEMIRLRDTYLNNNYPVCLSIGYPGHAVAYLIHQNIVYIFDTQKTETADSVVQTTQLILNQLFQTEFSYVDVLEKLDVDQGFQSDDDNMCVIWMLFILEINAQYFFETGIFAPQEVYTFLEDLCDKADSCLNLISQQLARYQTIQLTPEAPPAAPVPGEASSGGRRRHTRISKRNPIKKKKIGTRKKTKNARR